VLGTVETQYLNALSTRCQRPDEYLIALNRTLLNACLRLCNYAASCLTMSSAASSHAASVFTAPTSRADKNGVWPVDEIQREAIEQLAPAYRDLLTSVIESRMPDPRVTVSYVARDMPEHVDEHQSRERRWTRMEDCVTDFIVAHEYAHILLDHLEQADESPTEEHGGWGHEYHADSVGLNLLVYSWVNLVFGDTLLMSWAFQSVALSFLFISQIERYTAEILRSTDGVWRDHRSHPPTWLRYRRVFWQISRYEFMPWAALEPHLRRVEEFMEQLYVAAVGDHVARSVPTLEWRFQRLAFGSIDHGLYPQQLVVAARAVRSALESGTAPDRRRLESCAAAAGHDLAARRIQPLTEVTPALEDVTSSLGNAALQCVSLLGDRTTVQGFADQLERVMLRDARERYPA
jgi:hypothetical protein